jgi:hypothetical protein
MRKKRKAGKAIARKTARRPRKKALRARLVLTPPERDVLMQACSRYRNELPSYLEATQPQLVLIQEILRRLS